MHSTKEERIIRDSIAFKLPMKDDKKVKDKFWVNTICQKFKSFSNASSIKTLNNLIRLPFLVKVKKYSKLLTKAISGRNASFLKCKNEQYDSIEQFCEELLEQTLELVLMEVLRTVQKTTIYRFYHVFKKDELKTLVAMVPTLRLVNLHYEQANWWGIAEKVEIIL
ncbi:unnamed protein product [Thelazia callipaeda]|uniref:Uncharacterized protein n=1 Tax=Thelazia callipaeda TaxID=103827 RepID=A0A0N5CNZ3_THECL|nr:unnamed protein product [Thelazia callipaeda]